MCTEVGEDEHGFMVKDKIVEYLQKFANVNQLPVRCGRGVRRGVATRAPGFPTPMAGAAAPAEGAPASVGAMFGGKKKGLFGKKKEGESEKPAAASSFAAAMAAAVAMATEADPDARARLMHRARIHRDCPCCPCTIQRSHQEASIHWLERSLTTRMIDT